jgi:amidase
MMGDPYYAPSPSRPFAHEVGSAGHRLRIGVLQSTLREAIPLHPECAAAVQNAGRLLHELGHTVEESHPEALSDEGAVRAYVTVVSCSVARALDAAAEKTGQAIGQDEVEPLTNALADMGRKVAAPQYIAAIESVHRFGRRLAEWWETGFDLLLTPTTAAPPPRLGELACPPDAPFQGFIRAAPFGVFTSAFNQSGQPAISLPLHWADGMPIGVQLVAAHGREDLLLRVGAELEAARPWRDRWPAIAA